MNEVRTDNKNIDILYQYLSDSAQKNLKENRTVIRY